MIIRYAVPVLLATVAATFAVIAPSNSTMSSSSSPRAKEATSALVPAPDVERVIRLTGITPEAFAAAGLDSVDCGTLFDSATVYCLQSDRLAEYESKISACNIAMSNAAVDPEKRRPLPGGGQAPAASVAKAALDDLRAQAFTFMITGLSETHVETLGRIVAAQRTSELPVQYLAATRTDEAGIELRGALSTKASLARRGLPASEPANAVVSAANENADVQAATSSLGANLASVKQVWSTRSAPGQP